MLREQVKEILGSLCLRPTAHCHSGNGDADLGIFIEYVFLRQHFGFAFDPTETEALTRWLFSKQKEDGSWGLAPSCPGDVSTTTETYLALKILGLLPDEPRMQAARLSIIRLGGLRTTRMFTRIFLASFGLISWNSLPALPAELILLPTQSIINVYNLSSWARTTCIPLLLIRHHEPVYALPNGLSTENDFLDELWTDKSSRNLSYATPLSTLWKGHEFTELFFTAADSVMCLLGRYFSSPLRSLSRNKIISWIIDHQEQSGEWAGYWPPHHNSLWALSLEGYSLDHPVMRRGFAAMSSFLRHDADGMRAQVTVSQVWDTALMAIALNDSSSSTGCVCPSRTTEWFLDHEISSHRGDWRILRPRLPPGGWCFEKFNTLYPDVDDSAATIISMIKTSPAYLTSGSVLRAVHWILGMQNNDGGWGAFDWNNDKEFLNKLPFSDMDSLCDPSTPDVTGRIIECFGIMLSGHNGFTLGYSLAAQLQASCKRAIAYLLACQEANGTWRGRWAINYIYGSSNVLCGLSHFYNGGSYFYNVESRSSLRKAVDCAIEWLKTRQNLDGGWGELPQSYDDASQAGHGPSTAPQSAWAIMALVNYLPPDDECVRKGISYLVHSQIRDEKSGKASWPLVEYTGTGFPGHLYMEYGYYRHYFPIMALGRYASRMSASKIPL